MNSTNAVTSLRQRRQTVSSDAPDLFGIRIHDLPLEKAANRIIEAIKNDRFDYVCTPNAKILSHALHDGDFAAILNRSLLSLPDGIGVVSAFRMTGRRLACGRVCGVELGERVLELAATNRISVFFYGGKRGCAERASENMRKKYKNLKIVGTHDGFSGNPYDILHKIDKSGAQIVFVCLGSPKQELFAANILPESTSVKIALCLGGSLDIYSGNVRRAPRIVRFLCLEWLWRILSQPKRITDILPLVSFCLDIAKLGFTAKTVRPQSGKNARSHTGVKI